MIYLSILMISNIYAESITIYATQSASYRASGSGSSGCCALNSIGYNNSNTLSASSCTWWSQYGQCERRTSYPIWSFNFLQLPSNATVVSVSFDAEGLYDEWHDSYMALSSETGEITIQMGSYLVNGGDWSIDGQTWTWWNQGLNINQALPVSEVELGIDSGQLNIAVHEYDATIINSGLNAPRLVIEYELLDYECSEMNEMECSSDNSCEWIENIEIEFCGGYNQTECLEQQGCWWYPGGWYLGEYCSGSYEVDNSYCVESEDFQCQDYQFQCSDGTCICLNSGCLNNADSVICDGMFDCPDGSDEIDCSECSWINESACSGDANCNWIENIETGNCNWLSTSECVDNPQCWLDCTTSYDCFGCTGGWYEIDNGFCEEVSFILGDVNGDGSLNISDIVLWLT